MPINHWKHVLYIADLIEPLQRDGDEFDTARVELVSRIRSAAFYDEDDIVLRNVVNDLESAGNTVQLGRELDLLMLWGDKGQRVWVETVSR